MGGAIAIESAMDAKSTKTLEGNILLRDVKYGEGDGGGREEDRRCHGGCSGGCDGRSGKDVARLSDGKSNLRLKDARTLGP